MNILIDARVLEEALTISARGCPGKVPLPICAMSLLRADHSGRLQITTTNLEIAIRASAPANVLDAGSVLLPAALLLRLARELPNSTVMITTYDDSRVLIEADNDSMAYWIQGTSCEEFPDPFVRSFAPQFTLDWTALGRVHDQVSFATSSDLARLSITGLWFEPGETGLTAVATDGKCLSRVTVPATLAPKATRSGLIVPKSLLEAYVSVAYNALVQVSTIDGDKEALFHGADEPNSIVAVQAWCKLIDGPYPKWREVVRSEHPFRPVVDRSRLLDALRRILSLRASPSAPLACRIIPMIGAGLEIQAGDHDAAGSEMIALDEPCDAPAWDIDAAKLEALLTHTPGDQVVLGISCPDQAIHVFAPGLDASATLLLLMPLAPKKGA